MNHFESDRSFYIKAMTMPTFRDTNPLLRPQERILETARALFYSRGAGNVGIDLIIAESGVAKATLYKHFKSKDELIVAYMRQGDLRWLEWLQGAVSRLAPAPENQLMAVWDALEEWFSLPLFRGCLLTNTVIELAQPEHLAGAVLLEHKERVRGYLETLAVQAGVGNSRQTSQIWMLLLEGATVTAARERTPDSAELARKLARDFLGQEVVTQPQTRVQMLEHLDFEF